MAKTNDYDRVTTALYPFSGLQHVPEYILGPARERGELVDKYCKALMDDMGVISISPNYQPYIESFKKWMIGKRFIERPPRFYCNTYKFTGEVDGLCFDEKDDLVLFDTKATSAEGKTWEAQAAAYLHLCLQAGLDVKKVEFVRLLKTGEYPEIYKYKANFQVFLEPLNCYRKYFKNMKVEESIQYVM